ncbi:MAG: Sir2 family NAD-dependent protein deacetylase [Myxococcota bacterium]
MYSRPGKIDFAQYRHIVVLTGAGVSAASGLQTFRGPGGLWTSGGDAEAATLAGFREDPGRSWRLFGALREAAQKARPNAAHRALAGAEEVAPGAFTLVTQNVDGLHRRAGNRTPVEIHGNVHRTRCSNEGCELAPYDDLTLFEDQASCALCGAPLRPDVVLFDEPVPVDEEWAITRALRDCDLFVAVGTSGTVSPASNYVRGAAYVGARTVFVNLEAMEPKNPAFQETYLGRAEELLPELFASGR